MQRPLILFSLAAGAAIWIVFLQSDETPTMNEGLQQPPPFSTEVSFPNIEISRTNLTPIPTPKKEPSEDVLGRFSNDLFLLFESDDGLAFRYQQERDLVDQLLAQHKEVPVQSMPSLLKDAGAKVPIQSLDPFLVLGLREMEVAQDTFGDQADALKRFRLSKRGINRDPGMLMGRIRMSPLGFPPEIIFFAFSDGSVFPEDNLRFIQSVGRSRDRSVLLAASSWMEYAAWSASAHWLSTSPDYAESNIGVEDIKSVPAVSGAFKNYQETDQLYLSAILRDMAAFGYLK